MRSGGIEPSFQEPESYVRSITLRAQLTILIYKKIAHFSRTIKNYFWKRLLIHNPLHLLHGLLYSNLGNKFWLLDALL